MSNDEEMSEKEALETIRLVNRDEYTMTQELVITTCRTILLLPLVPFVNSANRAQTLGPIMDPTLYREGGEHLARIKRLAEILLTAQREIAEVQNEIKKELENNVPPSKVDTTMPVDPV